MAIPRVARIHFVYQFIILTLLICAISYIGVLPDKHFLLLVLIPVFSYQLIIIFYCTELIPLPDWLTRTETQDASNPVQPSIDSEPSNTYAREESKSAQSEISSSSAQCEESKSAISPAIPRARLYTKNKTLDSVSSSEANTQTTYHDICGTFKKEPAKPSVRRAESTKSYILKRNEKVFEFEDNLESKENKTPDSVSSEANTQTTCHDICDIFNKEPAKPSVRRAESTKSYILKRNQRRFEFEDNLDSKENFRSYGTRNWQCLTDKKLTKSQWHLKSPTQSIEETKKVTSPIRLETLDESTESDATDLTRSLSYPFRQKRTRQVEVDDVLNIPIMPAWRAIDYFDPSNGRRRRKSVSTEAIDRELKEINTHFQQKIKNDFTKSMEVSKESIEPAITKRGLKPSASFNKWKQGVANYFCKTKRGNVDADENKTEDNKKPFYKELFLSKDVFNQGKEPDTKSRSPFSKFQNVKIESRSPSYISYNDYFE